MRAQLPVRPWSARILTERCLAQKAHSAQTPCPSYPHHFSRIPILLGVKKKQLCGHIIYVIFYPSKPGKASYDWLQGPPGILCCQPILTFLAPRSNNSVFSLCSFSSSRFASYKTLGIVWFCNNAFLFVSDFSVDCPPNSIQIFQVSHLIWEKKNLGFGVPSYF